MTPPPPGGLPVPGRPGAAREKTRAGKADAKPGAADGKNPGTAGHPPPIGRTDGGKSRFTDETGCGEAMRKNAGKRLLSVK